MVPDPPAPPAPPAPPSDPPPAPPPSSRKVTCEFCGCQLTSTGDVLRFSDSARAMRTHEETIAALRTDLAAAKADVAAKETRIAELMAEAKPKREPYLTIT